MQPGTAWAWRWTSYFSRVPGPLSCDYTFSQCALSRCSYELTLARLPLRAVGSCLSDSSAVPFSASLLPATSLQTLAKYSIRDAGSSGSSFPARPLPRTSSSTTSFCGVFERPTAILQNRAAIRCQRTRQRPRDVSLFAASAPAGTARLPGHAGLHTTAANVTPRATTYAPANATRRYAAASVRL